MASPASDRVSNRLRTVSSRQNPLVKDLRQAFVQSQLVDGMCAVEGTRLIEEAIRSGLKIRALFVRESAQTKADRILDQLSKHAEAVLLTDTVFDSAVSTEHPQGIAALVKVQERDLDSALATAPALLVVAAAIQDPGNLGTLVRSAEAFGATAMIATEGTVNHWSPKTVRSSAGSMFRLPVVRVSSAGLISELHKREIAILALSAPHSGQDVSNDGTTARSPKRLQDADL